MKVSKKRGLEEPQAAQSLQDNLLLSSVCMDRKSSFWFILFSVCLEARMILITGSIMERFVCLLVTMGR